MGPPVSSGEESWPLLESLVPVSVATAPVESSSVVDVVVLADESAFVVGSAAVVLALPVLLDAVVEVSVSGSPSVDPCEPIDAAVPLS
jgi:hypothetical protein